MRHGGGEMDTRTDEIHTCVLQDIGPLGLLTNKAKIRPRDASFASLGTGLVIARMQERKRERERSCSI